jgi:hypothetical protein
MKTIIILALAIVFSFSSCTDDEQIKNKNISPLVSLNSDSIKSLLIGKWQATSVSGVGGPTDAKKDSVFNIFTDNSYYEFYKKDSLPRRDMRLNTTNPNTIMIQIGISFFMVFRI